jgi:hypothetical protein
LELSQPNSRKTLAQALEAHFGNFSESLNCVKIGKIENVDTTNQTVDVQILHKRVNMNFKTRELKDYSLLKQVPFVVIGGGQANLTFPISKGDNCLLLFCDYEIDRWWDTGESLPSNFERKHDISDAFAIVGIHSMVDLLQGYSQYVQLKYSDSSYVVIGDSVDINNEQTNVSGKLDVTGDITGSAKATAELHSTHGATGTFTNVSGQTLTIVDGIITNIS